MIAALTGDERALRFFVRIGGDATVRSYMRDDAAYAATSFAELFPRLVPQSHKDFLHSADDVVTYRDYAFVHAGIRPGVPLDRQKMSDMRWIREDFLSSDEAYGSMIVHGHNISAQVEVRHNRIGVGTGAYASGKLTALALAATQSCLFRQAAWSDDCYLQGNRSVGAKAAKDPGVPQIKHNRKILTGWACGLVDNRRCPRTRRAWHDSCMRKKRIIMDPKPRPRSTTPQSFLMVAVAALLLTACASGKPLVSNPNGSVLIADALPEPVTVDAAGDRLAFSLGPNDVVSVKVFGSEDAGVEQVRLDQSGRLSVPIAGVINAQGMSLERLEDEIETRLRARYFRNPQVSVALLEVESSLVTVDGEVIKPGIYPALPDMTLMQAVASAQGATETAKLNEVVIFRTVDNQKYAALYDLRAIRRGQYADPRVFDDDVVLIGDSNARRLFLDFVQLIPLLTTPLIIALQN